MKVEEKIIFILSMPTCTFFHAIRNSQQYFHGVYNTRILQIAKNWK